MLQNGVMRITDYKFFGSGTMTFDLLKIAEDAGKTVKVPAYTDSRGVRYSASREVLLPIPQARRILSFIVAHMDPLDVPAVDEIFKENPRLYAIWEEKLRKAGMRT